MGTSHGVTGWPCKAPDDEADLVTLPSAREGPHRDIVGAVPPRCKNLCLKGLTLLLTHFKGLFRGPR